jgi:hypothetical protein
METSTRFSYVFFIIYYYGSSSIKAAARSKAWSVFARRNARIMGSNPNQDMDVCLQLFCVYVGSGLETDWSPVQGVLPNVQGLIKWSETNHFKDALCSKVEQQEREREIMTLQNFVWPWPLL